MDTHAPLVALAPTLTLTTNLLVLLDVLQPASQKASRIGMTCKKGDPGHLSESCCKASLKELDFPELL